MKSTRFVMFVVLAVAVCVAGAAVAQTVVKSEIKSGLVIGKTDHSVIVKGDDGVVGEVAETAVDVGEEGGFDEAGVIGQGQEFHVATVGGMNAFSDDQATDIHFLAKIA